MSGAGLDAVMGLRQELAGREAVPQSYGVLSEVRVGRPQTSSKDSHYSAGIDMSLEQSSMYVVEGAGHADRTGGWTAVAMVACRAERGRVRHGPAGNAPCESGALGDGGEDRSSGRPEPRSTVAHGLIPAGASPKPRRLAPKAVPALDSYSPASGCRGSLEVA
jgi:hypothetical protein